MRDVGVTRVIAPDTATYANAYQAASREFKDRFGDDALTGIHCTSPDTRMPDGNSCGYGQLTHATEFGQAMCRQTGMTCGDQNTFARIMAMAAAGGMMSGNGIGGRGQAAGAVHIGDARFAQKSFSETFSRRGLFRGKTVNDVAAALKSRALLPKSVPVNVIVRDGNTLILNTRSAQALERAQIPRGSWNVVDRTGDPIYERLLDGQLSRNGLDSRGYIFPK